MSHFGSNKSGYLKIYKLGQYLERQRTSLPLGIIFGSFSAIVAVAYYYRRAEFDVWMKNSYGAYIPLTERIGLSYGRYLLRKLRCKLHEWKLVSNYRMSKYNPQNVEENNFMLVLWLDRMTRKREYNSFRDKSMDFLNPGFDEFDSYNHDRLP